MSIIETDGEDLEHNTEGGGSHEWKAGNFIDSKPGGVKQQQLRL